MRKNGFRGGHPQKIREKGRLRGAPLFPSDLVRGVYASTSVARRGHLRASHVLLDGSRKKRDCS